ncbi:hypothetical protein BU23DRAFT_596033 [Bimuria novae-zelandiae CBS 107.79]|uniref:Uncharacterized protein n=1 Tax=Bimuria novae-zelandiae CBS 107.79 TaxID=1447943 RepID=A0A6A5VKD9_9PLEO|nr:hypothetical protein BU23DRAFT_596033 [Bimuria novae-zelandiae CBS 107.79]
MSISDTPSSKACPRERMAGYQARDASIPNGDSGSSRPYHYSYSKSPATHLEAYILRPVWRQSAASIELSYEIERLALDAVKLQRSMDKLGHEHCIINDVCNLESAELRLINTHAMQRNGTLVSVQVDEVDMARGYGQARLGKVVFILNTTKAECTLEQPNIPAANGLFSTNPATSSTAIGSPGSLSAAQPNAKTHCSNNGNVLGSPDVNAASLTGIPIHPPFQELPASDPHAEPAPTSGQPDQASVTSTSSVPQNTPPTTDEPAGPNVADEPTGVKTKTATNSEASPSNVSATMPTSTPGTHSVNTAKLNALPQRARSLKGCFEPSDLVHGICAQKNLDGSSKNLEPPPSKTELLSDPMIKLQSELSDLIRDVRMQKNFDSASKNQKAPPSKNQLLLQLEKMKRVVDGVQTGTLKPVVLAQKVVDGVQTGTVEPMELTQKVIDGIRAGTLEPMGRTQKPIVQQDAREGIGGSTENQSVLPPTTQDPIDDSAIKSSSPSSSGTQGGQETKLESQNNTETSTIEQKQDGSTAEKASNSREKLAAFVNAAGTCQHPKHEVRPVPSPLPLTTDFFFTRRHGSGRSQVAKPAAPEEDRPPFDFKVTKGVKWCNGGCGTSLLMHNDEEYDKGMCAICARNYDDPCHLCKMRIERMEREAGYNEQPEAWTTVGKKGKGKAKKR